MTARRLAAEAGWPAIGLFCAALLTAPLIAMNPTFTGEDWDVIRHGAELIISGDSPYADPKYRWSPVAAWISAPVLVLPYGGWIALHVAAILGLREWRASAIALVSWPFWQDAGVGNVIVFVVLAGWWALRRNRFAALAYLGLCVLMPRPLMLPLAAWLLWTNPWARWPAAGLFAGHAVLVALSGHGLEWLGVLATAGRVDMENPYAIGPAKVIGAAWIVIGIPLALVLTRYGRLGLAGLAASPYWLPYYLLVLLLELDRIDRGSASMSSAQGDGTTAAATRRIQRPCISWSLRPGKARHSSAPAGTPSKRLSLEQTA